MFNNFCIKIKVVLEHTSVPVSPLWNPSSVSQPSSEEVNTELRVAKGDSCFQTLAGEAAGLQPSHITISIFMKHTPTSPHLMFHLSYSATATWKTCRVDISNKTMAERIVAVALDRWTLFKPTECRTTAGRPRVDANDVLCSNAVNLDGQCLPDAKLYYHHLIVAVYIQPCKYKNAWG